MFCLSSTFWSQGLGRSFENEGKARCETTVPLEGVWNMQIFATQPAPLSRGGAGRSPPRGGRHISLSCDVHRFGGTKSRFSTPPTLLIQPPNRPKRMAEGHSKTKRRGCVSPMLLLPKAVMVFPKTGGGANSTRTLLLLLLLLLQ